MLNKKGFTLLETIMYVALIGSVVGAFISFVLLISGLRNKIHAINEIRENSRTFEEIVAYYMRNSESVIVPAKFSTSTNLTIASQTNGQTWNFFASDGIVYFDDGTTTPVTTNDINITGLTFANLAASGTKDTILVTGNMASYASSSLEYSYDDDFRFNSSIPFLKQ